MDRKGKRLLLISVIVLVIIGLSYVVALGQQFRDQAFINALLIELVPEKCRVVKKSEGVDASVEFKQDESGNIVDRTYIRLIAKNVYAGANVSFSIVAKNISSIPLSVNHYMIEFDSDSNLLEDLMYFSGNVKVYSQNSEYYNLIGSFEDVGIKQLADNLTNIMKYRKIDINQEIEIELYQQFKDGDQWPKQEGELSYMLMPIFIQYFPD